MKNTVFILSSVFIGILSLMIILTISGRTHRTMELESNLSSIVEEMLEEMVLNPEYSMQNIDAWTTELAGDIALALDAVSDLKIDILQADSQKGILSVRATLFYTHPNGKLGTVSSERHAIFDKKIKQEQKNCRVTFYVGEGMYKEYVIAKGSIIAAPLSPVLQEGVFLGWVDSSGTTVDFSTPVLQDVVYYANGG